MRPYSILYLPDMWNDWHWFIHDACDILVAQSEQGHFHLIDAQKEAEAVLHYRKAS